MNLAYEQGHWVILQNVHLVAKWLSTLEKTLEKYGTGSHEDFRVFMSAEPAGTPSSHIIPQGILENAIKITNEPPTGIRANLHKALDNFNQETLEMCSRENEFKSILQSLYNFLEANSKVPWDDLRYLFGDIMYGGHITDDWDRILCKTYLEILMHPDQLETEFYLAPGYPIPPESDYAGYHAY